MALEWAASLLPGLLEWLGIESRKTRDSRGAILGALTRFHGLVSQVCGGYSLVTPEVVTAFRSELEAAYQSAAIKVNEESQWVGKAWLNDVDRLMALGRRAVIRYEFAYSNGDGPSRAKMMDEAHQDCLEFRTLFERLRGGRRQR
jgi:hypothetical protein